MKIYLLSTYEEHGAEEVRATIDPSKLTAMLHDYGEPDEHELTKLAIAVQGNVAGKFGLSREWGGVQLHIVEVE